MLRSSCAEAALGTGSSLGSSCQCSACAACVLRRPISGPRTAAEPCARGAASAGSVPRQTSGAASVEVAALCVAAARGAARAPARDAARASAHGVSQATPPPQCAHGEHQAGGGGAPAVAARLAPRMRDGHRELAATRCGGGLCSTALWADGMSHNRMHRVFACAAATAAASAGAGSAAAAARPRIVACCVYGADRSFRHCGAARRTARGRLFRRCCAAAVLPQLQAARSSGAREGSAGRP
eukprot:TRINITY_DN6582_c2_g2_i1.p2 TRINITY_DN6582_c2_g2~~TRINITY_DN6582_c2_g2_i1.p2  ORF type:complete len:241 (+),score=53.45 TRINITY_DN6582_c2_g2_i1:234-956(+)